MLTNRGYPPWLRSAPAPRPYVLRKGKATGQQLDGRGISLRWGPEVCWALTTQSTDLNSQYQVMLMSKLYWVKGSKLHLYSQAVKYSGIYTTISAFHVFCRVNCTVDNIFKGTHHITSKDSIIYILYVVLFITLVIIIIIIIINHYYYCCWYYSSIYCYCFCYC